MQSTYKSMDGITTQKEIGMTFEQSPLCALSGICSKGKKDGKEILTCTWDSGVLVG